MYARQPALPGVTRNRSNRFLSSSYCVTKAPCAAFAMIAATACGCDT
jgi:hypothetical protein